MKLFLILAKLTHPFLNLISYSSEQLREMVLKNARTILYVRSGETLCGIYFSLQYSSTLCITLRRLIVSSGGLQAPRAQAATV